MYMSIRLMHGSAYADQHTSCCCPTPKSTTAAAWQYSLQAKARAAEQREKRKEEAAERRAEEATAKRVRKEEMRARNLARSRGARDAISLGDVRPPAQNAVDALSITVITSPDICRCASCSTCRYVSQARLLPVRAQPYLGFGAYGWGASAS